MSLSYVCCACHQCIFDPLVYECDARHFHKTCLKCQMCLAPNRDKLYAINGLLVCREDYTRLRSCCQVCGQRIDANDYRFETKTKQSIHTSCMSCGNCRTSLSRGDKYVLTTDCRLLCQKCHQLPQRRGRKRANNNN